MRVGVSTCASMRAAVVDATRAAVVNERWRVYYHLCQHACGGLVCASMCASVVNARGHVYYHLCCLASCVKTPSTKKSVHKHETCAEQHETTRFLAFWGSPKDLGTVLRGFVARRRATSFRLLAGK